MDVQLTKEQELTILRIWNESPTPPPLSFLVEQAFPGRDLDGRSKEGRTIKRFLSQRNLRARPSHEYQPKQEIELTEDQKTYVTNHAALMSPVEMAKSLFSNSNLTNLHQETIVIRDYVKSLDTRVLAQPDLGEYSLPKTFAAVLTRINKYVHSGYDKNKLTGHQKRCVDALLGYLHTFRFSHQVGTYSISQDIELFESSFIRFTYDKDDLTEEEVDQYIVLCTEVVISANIQQNIGELNRMLRNAAEETDGRRISQGLWESLSDARKEYNQCVTRQQKLLADLKVKRSSRLENEKKDNASILNLVELWKEEESRKKMIKLAKMREQIVGEEIERLSSMDELKFQIWGISKDEALYG